MMKALSLSQPWNWSMLDPIADKDIENRTWPPPIPLIGEMIALHAAKSWDNKKAYRVLMGDRVELVSPIGYFLHHGIDHFPARRELYPTSVINGVAVIDRVVTDRKTLPEKSWRWFFGPYGWVVPRRIALPEPIPCAGKQGLWTVPEDVEERIRAQLKEVA